MTDRRAAYPLDRRRAPLADRRASAAERLERPTIPVPVVRCVTCATFRAPADGSTRYRCVACDRPIPAPPVVLYEPPADDHPTIPPPPEESP